MTKAEIVAHVNEIMTSGFELTPDRLVPTASLKNDLGLDSLDAVDMLVLLEEKLGTKVEGERFVKIQTLGDVYDVIYEQVLLAQNVTVSTQVPTQAVGVQPAAHELGTT
jgi:acyl carrier protein